MSEINKLSRELGDSFSVGRNSLLQQLVDDRIIISNGKRSTTTIRVSSTRQMSLAVVDKKEVEVCLSRDLCPPSPSAESLPEPIPDSATQGIVAQM